MAAAASSGNRLFNLWKQGWKEIPEVMASSFLALIGVGLAGVGLNIRMNKRPDQIMHNEYVVYRDDDPKAAPFKKTS